MVGYAGKIAKINLSSGIVGDYLVSDQDRELFIGGKTLAAKVIYDSFKSKVEAFSEENIIVITTSPLTSSTSPCSSRFNVSTISPLTGLLVSSNCGGSFGLHLKRAGYDGLVICGKSKEKVYIDITSEDITIKNAEHLWGKNTGEAQDLLGGKGRGKFVIGIAGENMVRYAAVISEERAAGRGGVGAVFGFKNLKGIVASGKENIEISAQEGFKKHNQNWIKKLKSHLLTGEQLPKLGTAGLVSMMNFRNQLATKNYSRGNYDDFEAINGETLKQDYTIKNKGCVTCPIQCGRVVKAYGKEVKGPELETLGLLGSNLLNNDLQSILNLNHLCDEYGLDTISFGSSVGFAMELNEKGLWKNGLTFGDCSLLEELVKQVATREGIGDVLAEGTKRISERYGGSDFAMNVKGLEIAAYEPRAAQGMGLGYATSNRGGCHLNGGYLVVLEGLGLNVSGKIASGKAAYTIFFQDLMEAVSAGGTCLFTTYSLLPEVLVKNPNQSLVRFINKAIPSFSWLVGLLHNHTSLMNFNLKSILPHPYSIKAVTGFNATIGSFIKTGERGYNLERIINLRQGLKGSDDTLPKRLTSELQRAEDADSQVKLQGMLKDYYKIRGWDDQGVPTKRRLKKLGLEDYGV
ncbi:aldehyde ferredoxin oxidoreductase family protein [Desulfosporosinus sp. BICA1-9]|uniref:aldehyde ferredoxin oxidoreductase family protein n=1 Tax=Desulfosporosinus sp. BICA1-9 TaxID=1531958 RepID=UPI00054C2C8C|nr:aldehyde ferredoxin oxidoreductase family protein [Desulfosporosinus sp. BICA1-9]KJS47114.1 MAG: aldehyde:ferredoxin oxidoreductase [Peptococcaceae bacterium BRH_c23]KJS79770.1 MAG: aldehyde:ferredoxin oxidoreductase [Desulfosporosinus sp. BICA1-9]HBW39036.1 aldehyde:ferredoxin oxidoreductase [Desulfosporosinus sp.]